MVRLGGRRMWKYALAGLPALTAVGWCVWVLAFDIGPSSERIERSFEKRLAGYGLALHRQGERASNEWDFVWLPGRGVVAGTVPPSVLPAAMAPGDWKRGDRDASKVNSGWLNRELGGELKTLVWARRGEGFVGTVRDFEKPDYSRLVRGYALGGAFALAMGVLSAWAVFLLREAELKDDFLAAAAHDLTTPLVGMRYAIGRSDADARCLNERMIRLVDNIKDFLRLGGRRRPNLAAVDLMAAYREAYAIFRDDYRDLFGGDDVVVAEQPPDGRLLAAADETMAVQILWNLLGNDLKYAAPYGRVSVSFRRTDAGATVELADQGQGMTRSQRARAFDRYYRARTVLETGKGGFGIGLCTAREFARAMGGELSVRANSPKGCVFTLTLPGADQLPEKMV